MSPGLPGTYAQLLGYARRALTHRARSGPGAPAPRRRGRHVPLRRLLMSTQLVLAILTTWALLALAGGLTIGATIRWADHQTGQR